MLQNRAMINLKTKFEGSSIRPCAKHSVEQRESRKLVSNRAGCWHGNSHGNMYPWLNKNVNLQHYFFRIKVFKVIDEVGEHSVLGLIGILVVVANWISWFYCAAGLNSLGGGGGGWALFLVASCDWTTLWRLFPRPLATGTLECLHVFDM